MATVQGNLINYNGDKVAPNTLSSAVYDAAKQQALSATLVNTPDKSTLGYPAFSTLSNYAVGDVVYYLTKLWRFVSAHTRGDWNAAEVEEFSVKDLADELDAKKADKATGAVTGNLAQFDAEGNPVDAGVSAAEKADKATGAVTGNLAQFDAEGNPVDAGVSAAEKANIDGYYEQLVAGLAENLVDTKGTGSEQEFTDRTSCGDESIADDGTGVIKELRGNSLAWNQLFNGDSGSVSLRGISCTITNGRLVGTGVANNSSQMAIFGEHGEPLVVGHKYFVYFSGNITNASIRFYYGTYSSPLNAPIIVTATSTSNVNYAFFPQDTTSTVSIDVRLFFVDLTLMFGAGNEPSTVAEFEALYPEPYYPYNAGAIIINAAATLVTDGFNQWDEEWELGTINTTTGEKEASNYKIRSANYIAVFPGTVYGVTIGGDDRMTVAFYDAAKNFISSTTAFTNFTTPANAYFILFTCRTNYGTTYKNDICINISWSGYRDGEYEPYWKRETGVDMRKIYGKLNGAGEMVQVFPAGGRSAGSVFDVADLVRKEADVRVGSVDMGTLTWQKGTYAFYATIAGFKSVGGVICPKYAAGAPGTEGSLMADNSICSQNDSQLYARDDSYSSAAAFKTAMNGVMLNCELETPLHYTDLMYSEDGGETFIDIPTVFKVADFGTERIRPLVDAQGNPVTAPFRAVIQYNDDFTREIVNLPKNYDTTGSLDDLLSELASALGTALGGTLTITRGAYNAATKKYAWTVSFAASESPAENTD